MQIDFTEFIKLFVTLLEGEDEHMVKILQFHSQEAILKITLKLRYRLIKLTNALQINKCRYKMRE